MFVIVAGIIVSVGVGYLFGGLMEKDRENEKLGNMVTLQQNYIMLLQAVDELFEMLPEEQRDKWLEENEVDRKHLDVKA